MGGTTHSLRPQEFSISLQTAGWGGAFKPFHILTVMCDANYPQCFSVLCESFEHGTSSLAYSAG